MKTYDIMEINIKAQPFILFAPKIKFKKPTIFPTHLSLNDSLTDSYLKEDLNSKKFPSYKKHLNLFVDTNFAQIKLVYL